jgi:hypothetical protein
MTQTTNSRVLYIKPSEVYNALIAPSALEVWQAPGDMKAKIHLLTGRSRPKHES